MVKTATPHLELILQHLGYHFLFTLLTPLSCQFPRSYFIKLNSSILYRKCLIQNEGVSVPVNYLCLILCVMNKKYKQLMDCWCWVSKVIQTCALWFSYRLQLYLGLSFTLKGGPIYTDGGYKYLERKTGRVIMREGGSLFDDQIRESQDDHR